jgi:hypothetical protein
MTEHIEPAHWEAFADDFSKKHHGFEARLEILGRTFGDQDMAAWLPFSGLSYDPHHRQIFITLGGISSRYPVHLTHKIEQPQGLALHHTAAGEVSAVLVIGEDNTETLLHLRAQPQLTA